MDPDPCISDNVTHQRFMLDLDMVNCTGDRILNCYISLTWLGRSKLQEQPMANLTRVDDVSSLWTIQDTDSEFTMFHFRQILESTDNFCNENKLGQGGFGAVYKVVCYAIISTLSVVYIY
jgi:hypothetical protein